MEGPVAAFLDSKGLGAQAQRIIEATEAETIEDLKMIDAAMVEEVVRAADLKLVSAKKLRLALAELRGETLPEDPAPPPAAAEAAAAPQPAAPAATEEVSFCANGHKMDNFLTNHTGFTCDVCLEAQPQGSPMRGCRQCDFDVCSKCKVEAPPDPGAASAPSAGPPVPAGPQECIVVCIDRSGSMGTALAEVTVNVVEKARAQRTRMEAVKAMFYAFRDRVDSIGRGSFHMGLVQFDHVVERMLDLTPQLGLFESIVDDVEKRGQTAIYSSIIEAVSMLEPHFSEDSQTDLRVMVLTDGSNNAGFSPDDALTAANKIGAVVDAIIVGDNPDANLRRIVTATNGECYQIGDLGEGFELLEAESVVSLRARRGGAEKPKFQRRATADLSRVEEKGVTKGTDVARAPVLDASLASKKVVDAAALAASGVQAKTATEKRLLAELAQASRAPEQGIHIFPSPDDMLFWRVLLEGPEGSPFHGGVFALSVVIPSDYPFKPPKVNFETPVYHCGVSDSGKICLGVLLDAWSPANTIPRCLESIKQMLKEPDTGDSLRQWIAELTLAHQKTNGADTRYYDKARESTSKDASKTVAEWKAEWGC